MYYFLEESTGYMEPSMSFFAIIHTVISVLCIIGYNCLKVHSVSCARLYISYFIFRFAWKFHSAASVRPGPSGYLQAGERAGQKAGVWWTLCHWAARGRWHQGPVGQNGAQHAVRPRLHYQIDGWSYSRIMNVFSQCFCVKILSPKLLRMINLLCSLNNIMAELFSQSAKLTQNKPLKTLKFGRLLKWYPARKIN